MNVLVNGIGNIGTSVLNLLIEHKELLGVKKILAHKNFPVTWSAAELEILKEKGVVVCTEEKYAGLEYLYDHIHDVDYIFDCTTNGVGLKNKKQYQQLKSLKACSAQGSEKGFGLPFMSGINDHKISKEKFVHVVSCNTHALASILSSFSCKKLQNLEKADFVIVRRSEDIGNHQRLVSASVVARHLDDVLGTHHAIDVCDLFETIHVKPEIQSSDVSTPSQMMHSVRFYLELKDAISKENIMERIEQNPYLSCTEKFDSNVIFELGRKYSFLGRIYAHAIIVCNNILIKDKAIYGWAFIPQEGNTLLSTLHAFLLQTANPRTQEIMEELHAAHIIKTW